MRSQVYRLYLPITCKYSFTFWLDLYGVLTVAVEPTLNPLTNQPRYARGDLENKKDWNMEKLAT
jgi:hypothetical protein